MNKTKFVEKLSDLAAVEMDEVLSSSVKYENEKAKEIVVRTGDGSKFKITVEEID